MARTALQLIRAPLRTIACGSCAEPIILRRFRLPLLLLLILASVGVVFWSARRPLTEAAVGRWFAAQGVEARYRITALSPTSVSLARISLGPAARPDFTADAIDATVRWSALRPQIMAVRLVRPVLRAALTRNGISLGSLDRLIPANPAPGRALPDIDLAIVAGTLSVDTPAGVLAGRVDGSGRLGGGFGGRWQVARIVVHANGCMATAAGTAVTLATARDAVHIAAAGSVPRAVCAQGAADAVDWQLAATLPPTLDRYSARLDASAATVDSGYYHARLLRVRADAAAPALSAPLSGQARAQAEHVHGQGFSASQLAAHGPFRLDPRTGTGSLAAAVTVDRAAATPVTAAMRKAARQLSGTLAQPLYAALLTRTAAAARSFDAAGSLAIANDGDGFKLALSGLTARAATGAQLRQTGEVVISAGGTALAGGGSLSGGGLPSLTLTGSATMKGDRIRGSGKLLAAPWAVPGGAIHDLQIEARGDGDRTAVTGLVSVSGALGAGVTAQRLAVPIQLEVAQRGNLAFGWQCLEVAWATLTRDDIVFGPGAARVCPEGRAVATLANGRLQGRATLQPLRLRGRSGDVPVSVDAAALHVALDGSARRPVLHLAPARLAVDCAGMRAAALLDGKFDIAAASGTGRLTAFGLDAAALPVAVANGSGRWRFAGGRLELAEAAARINDRATPARFEPLRIDGASAVLARGTIDARGTGRLAGTGTRLFGFTATHALASAQGTATVETGLLRFGADLQPYQITEALRGVVDNVAGPVRGTGHIAWTGSTMTSHGELAIEHVSLATASLGPVDDIAGTLAFDDLLALTTPSGQRLTIKRINPGVAVDDGVVRFQMLGPDAAAIESIVWPYAGGTLTLAPVTVRAADAVRSFTLTVDGLDAEQFLQKFDIKDLNITGRFDGKLPLVFADGKGRIVAGSLVARPGGGLVQYVGAVGGEDTGAAARLAFDALRRLRYHSLALDLDGDLDGELVTQLRFAGTNEAATTLGGGPLPIRATGLPFRFNVTVRAPFRALLGTASSFSDVRPLIRPAAAGVHPQ